MHKMWKKALAVGCALTMMMSMSVIAGAAESPSGSGSIAGGDIIGGDNTGSGSATGNEKVNGVQAITENLWVDEVESEDFGENEQLITSDKGIIQILGEKYKLGTVLKLLSYVDLKYDPIDDAETSTVSVHVDGVSKGDTIYVLHYKVAEDDGTTDLMTGDWEVITPDEVGDGTVTFTCSSFSPFAFVKATKASTGSNGNGANVGTSGNKVTGSGNKTTGSGNKVTGSGNKTTDIGVKKSPKTGEF